MKKILMFINIILIMILFVSCNSNRTPGQIDDEIEIIGPMPKVIDTMIVKEPISE